VCLLGGIHELVTTEICAPYFSSVRLALQLTILTLSAWTVELPLSILKVTFLIRNVQTSSQKR
jgi:hypothetical protein